MQNELRFATTALPAIYDAALGTQAHLLASQDSLRLALAQRTFAAAAIRARPSALILRRFLGAPSGASAAAAALPEPGGRPRPFGAAALPPPKSPASSA